MAISTKRPTIFLKRLRMLPVSRPILMGGVVVVFAAVGTILLVSSKAATPTASFQAESGTLSGNASVVADSGASGGNAVKFSATAPSSSWPDASNTGIVGCPALTQVNNGDAVTITADNTVYENKELMNNAIINVKAHNVTIRCVKWHGTGYFGIDNTITPGNQAATDLIVDKIDMDCEKNPQIVGLLIKNATVTRANVHDCDHFTNVVGDNVILRDNYCHDLTNAEVVHADCVQIPGGADNILIEHNAFWSRDTSDILIGQEGGVENTNVTVNNNRLMTTGNPPPAYLIYVAGINTKITNNRFTRSYTYGPCTLNTAASNITWTNNVWDDTGAQIPLSAC